MHRGARIFGALAVILAVGCNDKRGAATLDAATLHNRMLKADAEDASTGAIDAGLPDEAAMPGANSDELQARMRHVVEAIAEDDADLAADVLFPREAYVAAKDVPDPLKVWDKHVASTFRRAVARTHKHVKGCARAKFVSFELGHSLIQLTPKKKDFKKPLWRVRHSTLTISVDGSTRRLEIAEMTAWRGTWYVSKFR